MQRTLSKDAPKEEGKEVVLKGWVKIVRSHGKIIFVDLRDMTGTIQIVVTPHSEEAHKIATEIRPEYVIEVQGTVNKRPGNTTNDNLVTGSVEVEAKNIKILSKSQTLPFDMGGEDLNVELPTLLDFRPLSLRHPSVAPIFMLQASVAEAFRDAARQLYCTEVFVPTISASSTEGGADVFKLNYYDHEAFLTQSPQLYKQIMVGAFERVYTISHAYRAEPSVTTRHLSEVVQMDIELGFLEFEELLDALEFVGTHIVKKTSEDNQDILKRFGIKEPLIPAQIPRLTLKEAEDVIFEYSKGKADPRGEKDLSATDEGILGEWAREEKDSDFVTVTHYPTAKRAFYTMPDPSNPEVSLSYDILFRGVEMASGSQRINDYDQLVKVIKDRGMSPDNFKTYLQAFAYGIPPEGGFSFGLERLTMKILELQNVREASLFPRDMERVDERFSSKKDK